MNHGLDGCAEKNGAVPGARKPRFFRTISDRSVASENTPRPYYSRKSAPQGDLLHKIEGSFRETRAQGMIHHHPEWMGSLGD